jgi:hypothetical protein
MIANGQPLTPENTEAVMSRYATVAAADFAGEKHVTRPVSGCCTPGP